MLRDLGLDTDSIRRVELQFDCTPSGTVYFDDVQFMNAS